MGPGTTRPALLERLSRRDRAWIGLALLAVTGVAWAYLVHLAVAMGPGMAQATNVAMPQTRPWSATALLLLFVMWVVMMVAMMLPSAAPTILLFGSVARRRREARRPYAPTAIFVAGYLLVWSGYSALATLAQWGLHSAALLSTGMASSSVVFGGTVLVAAGVFQWTQLKGTCLRACQSPLGWLTAEWRDGRAGALIMGVRHGAHCVGCCWALMALLFVAGVMNLLWVAVLTGFVLVEKTGPAGERVARVAGVLLMGWGASLLTGAIG